MNGRLGMVLTIAALLSGVGQRVLAQEKPAPIVEASSAKAASSTRPGTSSARLAAACACSSRRDWQSGLRSRI